MPKKIYLDIDDVVADCSKTMLRVLKDDFGKEVPFDDITDFDLGVSFDLDDTSLAAFFHTIHQPEILESMETFTGAKETMLRLKDHDAEIWLMTGRPPRTEASTKAWLSSNGIPYDHLFYVNKYGHVDEVPESGNFISLNDLKSMRFDYAVEDSATTAIFLAQNEVAPVLLMDRPWNRSFDIEGARRVTGWAQIDDMFTPGFLMEK